MQALRFHCAAYVHGHQVGGTNASLVGALGAGDAMLAHNNRFNRWVAGEGAVYFDGADTFAARMDELPADQNQLRDTRKRSQQRFMEAFTWPDVLRQYVQLLERYAST